MSSCLSSLRRSGEEFAPGGYRVRIGDEGGVTGQAAGIELDALLRDLEVWAERMDEGPGQER